jgi:hypothetical protein
MKVYASWDSPEGSEVRHYTIGSFSAYFWRKSIMKRSSFKPSGRSGGGGRTRETYWPAVRLRKAVA